MYKLITESKDIPDNFTGIVEWANGSKEWLKEGKLHRLDGPALEWADGDKSWYNEGKRHRLDGPACEGANGDKSWYIEGKKYSEKEFLNLNKTCKGKLVEIDGKKYQLVPVD